MATASSPETTLPAGADPAPADARPYRMPTRPVRRGITIAAIAVGAAAAALATGPGQLPGPAALAVAAIALQVPLGAPIAATDLRHHRIPNWLVLALAAGTLAALAVHPGLLLPGLAAAAAVGAGLLLLNLAGGMGMGDVKLAVACALAWGVHGVGITLLALGLGFVLSLPAALSRMRSGRGRERIPMGPSILTGSVLTLIWSLI